MHTRHWERWRLKCLDVKYDDVMMGDDVKYNGFMMGIDGIMLSQELWVMASSTSHHTHLTIRYVGINK
jgi:hypothetical protein